MLDVKEHVMAHHKVGPKYASMILNKVDSTRVSSRPGVVLHVVRWRHGHQDISWVAWRPTLVQLILVLDRSHPCHLPRVETKWWAAMTARPPYIDDFHFVTWSFHESIQALSKARDK